MPDGAHISDPLQAYRAALERRGYDADAVARRLRLAQRILAAIDPADTTNAAYRAAVDQVCASLADPAGTARCQRVARDFFPFFVAAGRALPRRREAPPAVPRAAPIHVTLPPHADLDDLIAQAAALPLSAAEAHAIETYAREIEAAGLPRDARGRRLAIARLLLLGMRPLPRDGRHYRAVIEHLLDLFTRNETRAYFLGVARDFHPHLFSAPAPRQADDGVVRGG